MMPLRARLPLGPPIELCVQRGERARLACRVRSPRRTHGPVGGAPTGAAEAAALPKSNCIVPASQCIYEPDRRQPKFPAPGGGHLASYPVLLALVQTPGRDGTIVTAGLLSMGFWREGNT